MPISHSHVFEFINRQTELKALASVAKTSGLIVIYGRRRVGKTRLMSHWLEKSGGIIVQAIEGPTSLQLEQLVYDLQSVLKTTILPKNWSEFLELLSLKGQGLRLCIDEFPSLVQSDPSLPSRLQKWVDHDIPNHTLLILSGSSQKMMHDIFLNSTTPLYGRAKIILQVMPMGFREFCIALRLDRTGTDNFKKYSVVGGMPKYWEYVQAGDSSNEVATNLYFSSSSPMEREPFRILRDENLYHTQPLGILEAIGRGAHRLSEIGARLQAKETSLSRPLQLLLDASIIERELPFGESTRSTKRTLYKIIDPALMFWFHVFLPHQNRWTSYSVKQHNELLAIHVSQILEQEFRRAVKGSRYWDGIVEFDCVREEEKKLVISELKWQIKNKDFVLDNLKGRFHKSKLAAQYSSPNFEVLDANDVLAIIGKPT